MLQAFPASRQPLLPRGRHLPSRWHTPLSPSPHYHHTITNTITITTLSPTLSPTIRVCLPLPFCWCREWWCKRPTLPNSSKSVASRLPLPCRVIPRQDTITFTFYHCLSLSLIVLILYHNAVFSFISWMASILLLYLVSPPSSFKSPPVFTLRSYLSPFIVSPLKLYLSRSFPLMLYFSFSPPWNFYLPLSSDAFTLSSGHSSKFLIFSARQNFHASRLLQPILKSNDSCHRIRGNFRKCQYRWAPDRCKNLENK